MKKKGLSTIIASLLMVLLVIILVGVVWGITKGIIDRNTDTSCFSNYGKITLNNDYTCYNKVGESYEIQFSVNVGDIDIDGVVATLISEASESYDIPNNGRADMKMYQGTYGEAIILPNKNGGKTYVVKDFGKADAIRIAPIINSKQCDISDSINEVWDCRASAS